MLVQQEVRETDEIRVTPDHIILIQARPPVTADEIAEQDVSHRVSTAELLKALIWCFIAEMILGAAAIKWLF